MNRTIVVLSRNRPMLDRTRHCVHELMRGGALFLEQSGTADVALARCDALTSACETIRRQNEVADLMKPRDTVLMVDDDMLFSIDQAQALVQHSRETGVASSAMYATLSSTLAATRIGGTDRWLTGLGLLAIPVGALLALERDSETFKMGGERVYTAFTWSGPEKEAWYSEDYRLCQRLGGVYMLPIAVGHLKVLPIYPDDETIAAIREDRRIMGEPDRELLEHIRVTHSKVGGL